MGNIIILISVSLIVNLLLGIVKKHAKSVTIENIASFFSWAGPFVGCFIFYQMIANFVNNDFLVVVSFVPNIILFLLARFVFICARAEDGIINEIQISLKKLSRWMFRNAVFLHGIFT